MVHMFELVFPRKIAEVVVKRNVKFIYDRETHELAEVIMPFDTKYEVTTLTLDKGWVTKASVKDVKLLPGVHRTMFELEGGEWVAREIAQSIKSGRAQLVRWTPGRSFTSSTEALVTQPSCQGGYFILCIKRHYNFCQLVGFSVIIKLNVSFDHHLCDLPGKHQLEHMNHQFTVPQPPGPSLREVEHRPRVTVHGK